MSSNAMTGDRQRMIDLYPSRVSRTPQILDRKDAVLHGGDSAPGPLTREQLQFYDQHGYLFLEGFFSGEEVQYFRDELQNVWEAGKHSDAPEIIREPESEEVRSVFAVHRNNQVFRELAQGPKLVDIMRQILGSEVYIHQSRINFKPGFKGKEFYWHSDFETWHVEDGMPRMRALSCSIALTDNHQQNGPLMVMPGSHRHFVSCVGDTPDDHYKQSLRRQEYGVPDPDSLTWLYQKFGIQTPTGKAGSILLFDCNIMHGSNSNITPIARSNVFLVYNSVENKLVEPFHGKKSRPDFIAERQ
ncbi:ectoine hydroxylase [Effusibacillus dendaii]|uniref:Ectoine hydroxylase n=1 Tax=Effusibacillus dendaii TaxID=2743772 RepID=A0A7I8D982_9BACL|nr:ectoine hydroxylase [Effusibacillus dendaii]BCJ86703.1 ectoine hydroxylase [Effusibacillus dendaii]